MPSAGVPLIRTGPQGATGATGATGTPMPNPFTTSGRSNGAWVPVLPLTGGTMTGGISFGSDTVGNALELWRHIELWWTGYGFSVTSSRLNCVSGGVHAFRTTAGALGFEIRNRHIVFATGHYINFDVSTGELIWFANTGGAMAGWHQGQFVHWGGEVGLGPSTQSGSMPRVQVHGRGIVYHNVGSHGFNFYWDGHVWGRADNAVTYPFQPQCDERLKQDIAPSRFDCLAAIRKLRLYRYRWRDYRNPRRPQPAARNVPTIPIGFVAQRLAEDFPEAVQRFPTAKFKGAEAMWNADPNTLMATLVGALQQLDRALSEEVS